MAKKSGKKGKGLGASLTSRYTPQAKSEAQLRYAPQQRTLASNLTDAKSQRDTAISAAEAGYHGARVAISEALPQLAQAFGNASAGVQGAARDIGLPAVSSLGPSETDAIRAATGRDVVASRSNLASALAASQADFAARGVDAAAGRVSQIGQAVGQYAKDASRIRVQQQGVAADKGTYVAGRTGELVDKARGRAVTRQGQKLAHQDRQAGLTERTRHDKQTEKQAATRAKQKKLGKPATPGQHETLSKSISGVLQNARTFAHGNVSRGKAASALLGGVPAQPAHVDYVKAQKLQAQYEKQGMDTANAKARAKQDATIPGTPAVPASSDSLAVSIALDLAYDGHISRNNIDRLHPTYSVKEIQKLLGQNLHPELASRPGGGKGRSSRGVVLSPAGRNPSGPVRPT